MTDPRSLCFMLCTIYVCKLCVIYKMYIIIFVYCKIFKCKKCVRKVSYNRTNLVMGERYREWFWWLMPKGKDFKKIKVQVISVTSYREWFWFILGPVKISLKEFILVFKVTALILVLCNIERIFFSLTKSMPGGCKSFINHKCLNSWSLWIPKIVVLL